MTRRLRHADPPQGREHFDLIAGREWERGPDPNEITNSIPDKPWNRHKAASQVIQWKGEWALTDFGLELHSESPERNGFYKIAAYELLTKDGSGPFYKWPLLVAQEPWVDIEAFATFEDCFYLAMPVHCRAPLRVPQTLDEAIDIHFHEEMYGKRTLKDQPCCADPNILEETFRKARGIVQRRASGDELKSRQPEWTNRGKFNGIRP